MNKILTLTVLVGCISCQLVAQNADSVWLVNNYQKTEKMIEMRDGVKLFTAIYTPKDNSEKHPILMIRTPYSCSPYGGGKFDWWLGRAGMLKFFKEKYVMVVQDVRGRYMSEGDFVDVRPFNPDKKSRKDIDESSDTYDAIDWLVKHVDHINGNVGVMGISYPGFYATMAGLSNHPSLKAISPQAPVTDWFQGDDFHHNGAFFVLDAFGFYSGFGKPRPKPTTEHATGYTFPTDDNYDFFLKQGTLANLTKLTGDSIKFWKDLYAHPNYDDFWKARNTRNFVTNIKPAVLVVGGLFDAEDCFGAWSLYKAIERKSPNTNNRLVMGPWYHGQWNRSADGSFLGNIRFGSKTSTWYSENVELPFFNYHLKGKGKLADLAEATIFFTGENQWRKLSEFPPRNMKAKPIYLHPDGSLSFERNKTATGFAEYVSDPAHPVPYTEDVHLDRTREYMTDDQRFASRRADVLTFTTPVLENDLTLAGPVTADLAVSITTSDADFVVKIIDVFPDDFRYNDKTEGNGNIYPMGGYQMLVRGEIMRGRYRNSFEKPEGFMPGEQANVKFDLPDVAHTFKKGHRLMLQIQSSWFPLSDRNPQQFVDIYQCKAEDFIKTTVHVWYGATRIMLPVME